MHFRDVHVAGAETCNFISLICRQTGEVKFMLVDAAATRRTHDTGGDLNTAATVSADALQAFFGTDYCGGAAIGYRCTHRQRQGIADWR